MNNNYIEFKKKRELGDILTDTFGFLRQNFKSLFSILLKTSGISFVLVLAATAYYTYATANLLDPVNLQSGNIFNSANILISFFALLITGIIFYGLLSGTILHYIKSYSKNQGIIDQESVVKGVKKDLGNIIGLAFLSGIIVGFGTLLCVLPGIYLYVPMSLVFSILIFRNTTVSDAISDSFQLVKNEWWITFATLLIIGILTYIISLIFSIPSFLYTMIKTFTVASEGNLTDASVLFDWVYIVLTVIASAARYLIMYIITPIAVAFIYFNLNERKHHTGTLEQIDSLGKSE